MIELSTPNELIEQTVLLIENSRKKQKLQQKELVLKANIPLPTYKDFLYKKRISFENLLKLLIALRLFDNIAGLLKEQQVLSLNDIKNNNLLPKRIVK
jgi:hypothetical protein